MAFPPSHDNRPPHISQNQGPRHPYSEPGLPEGRYAAGGYQPNALYMPESGSASMEEHTGSRMSFLTRKLSRSSSGSSGKNVADPRQSQLANLPLVEAQLLPSLRDTIDRMTSPQSTSKFPNLPSGDYQYERTYREEERGDSSKNFSLPSPMVPEDPAPPSSRLRRPTASAKASTSMAPQESHRGAGPKASESSRTPMIPKAKPKPILKSVLKGSLTNHAPSYNQHEPESPSKGSPSRSLRSVRSMFGKKTPQPSAPIAGPSNIAGGNASVSDAPFSRS
ncbi:hypothetical protein EWM64_g7013 [Hericium alpestre]|uniref:Uncharacterized protein n=1 Tax=Hericium alpestre TaxID=135208 RepID=A0A4Y9ZQF0_9AGAM|nr:hypothetical protein EWM64_g7013 [Hericium alpestre]